MFLPCSVFLNFAFVTFVPSFQVRRIVAQLAASPEAEKEKDLIRGQGEDVLPGFGGSRAWCGELRRPWPGVLSSPWLSSFCEKLEGGRGDLVTLGSSTFILEAGVYPVSEERRGFHPGLCPMCWTVLQELRLPL